MVITAKEIIRKAKWYGSIRNSNTSDFDTCNSILNNEYYRLYNDIVREVDEYVNWLDFDGREVELPADCMYIVGVYFKGDSDDALTPIAASPRTQYIPSEYKVENNTVKIIGSKQGRYTIKYAQMPPTITAPDENQLLQIDNIDKVAPNDEVSFYYLDGTTWYLYNTLTDTKTEATPSVQSTFTYEYGDKTIVVDKSNGFRMTGDGGIFDRDGLTIINADFDYPYAIITYNDNSVWIYTGATGTEWNVFNTNGHQTRGEALYMRTSDETGKGVLFRNKRDGKYYWCSFVPDTVLSYPNQVFFQLLEYRVASALAAIIGLNAQYVNEVLIPQAEVMFYDSIKKDHFVPTRITNINKQTMRYF